MARPKKDGKRATGIWAKKGYLYMIISRPVIENGIRKYKKEWKSTKLKDIPENVKKATEARKRRLNNKEIADIDYNILLTDFIDLYLDKKKREIAEATYSAYFYKAKSIKEGLGNVRVRDVNEALVEHFLDELFVVHEMQPRTVKDIKVLFGNIMDIALSYGIIVYNPVKKVVINKKLANKYAKDTDSDERFFSYEEAVLFLSKVKDHELYELFYITLFFGLRREEILGLRWSALDLKNKTMRINHTVTKGMTISRTNTTKTASSTRTYPLTDEQVELFKMMKKREKSNRRLCGNSYNDNDYVFKHVDGSLYYPDYPTKAFNKLIKKIPELPQSITFHGLRSSCVSILVHQGLDIKSIQKWVGHADIDTTLRIYAKVKDKESKIEISDVMKDIITLKDYSGQ